MVAFLAGAFLAAVVFLAGAACLAAAALPAFFAGAFLAVLFLRAYGPIFGTDSCGQSFSVSR